MTNLLEKEPNNVMGRVIELGAELMRTDLNLNDPIIITKLQNLNKLLHNESAQVEKLHVDALSEWHKGHYQRATKLWEDILLLDPFDMIALKFAHDAYFYLGESMNIMQSIHDVVGKFEENLDTIPRELYGYLQGMYAFGLEEANRYSEAEKAALTAIEINKDDAWAMHAYVHVKEMQGDTVTGLKFLDEHNSQWPNCLSLACHMHWHYCLYLIDQGRFEEALKIYDEKIVVLADSKVPLDLVDASSLLYRLMMEGFITKTDSRWGKVRNLWTTIIHSHCLPFNDAHISMVYNRVEESNVTDEHLQSLEKYIGDCEDPLDICRHVHKQVGLPICKAIDAFNMEKYDEAASILLDIVPTGKTPLIGGSHAQRDIFELILMNALIEEQSLNGLETLQKMIQVRKSKKPHSGQNQRLHSRITNKMN